MIVDVPALVRIQEGPAPVAVGAGAAAARRYMRARLQVRSVDTTAWQPRLRLNYTVAWTAGTRRRVWFFAAGKYLGSDTDFGALGQLGQVLARKRDEVSFALTLYRVSDQGCCPQGRTLEVRYRWNGKRLVQTRPLLREGLEPAEGLQLPSRNIGCIFNQSPWSVRCDIRTGLKPPPARPPGCDLDWAYGLEMSPISKPHTFCAGDTALAQGPILAYGATLRIKSFTCVSQRSGLRCTNRAGHGFFLSRRRWRVF